MAITAATQTARIHHVTAFCDDPQENYDFFTNVLGLRFVKRTVRFDVPEKIYHLYYGDEMGTPGTVITYFPMTNMPMVSNAVFIDSASCLICSNR